jgi:lysophospholipase L1-like esterase
MRELSEELKTDYVDMNQMTRDLMNRIGKEESMKFFVISTGIVKGKDGEPSKDTTHPIAAGAQAFSRLFMDDVKARKLKIAELFN